MNKWIRSVLDVGDSIDRLLYGERIKLFIIGALLVVLIVPLSEAYIFKSNGKLTFIFTLLFIIFMAAIILSWISTLRDDNGAFTLRRLIGRLKTYYEIVIDRFTEAKQLTENGWLYSMSTSLIVITLCWASLRTVSIFIRYPIESVFHVRLLSFRHFENFTVRGISLLLATGIVILFYVIYKENSLKYRLFRDLKRLNPFSRHATTRIDEVPKLALSSDLLVINLHDQEQIDKLMGNIDSAFFRQIVEALRNWHPKSSEYESDYQDKLIRHFYKHLPDYNVQPQYPIVSKEGNLRRADILVNDVNDSVLIEMKADAKSSTLQRAKGQIDDYASIWSSRGSVFLLFCVGDYQLIKPAVQSTIESLSRANKPALAFVL